jgi:hypothetical protein
MPMPRPLFCLVFAALFSLALTFMTGLALALMLTGVIPGAVLNDVLEAVHWPALFIGLWLGDLLKLPPAGMHAPNFIALWMGIAIQWFTVGFVLAIAVTAVRRPRNAI